jgi:hypothetical protein
VTGACDETALPQQSVTEENETLLAALAVSCAHADLTNRRLGVHRRLFSIFGDMMEIGSRRVKTVCILNRSNIIYLTELSFVGPVFFCWTIRGNDRRPT